jgi:hypothetical protein
MSWPLSFGKCAELTPAAIGGGRALPREVIFR